MGCAEALFDPKVSVHMKRMFLLLQAMLFVFASSASAQGTAFTYQGRLTNKGQAADGRHDLQFSVYDHESEGRVIGRPITVGDTPVSNGLFTVTLDFGKEIFTGPVRWLEVVVDGTVLSPRQKLSATPYAITAGNLTGPVPSSNLVGTYPGLVNFNNTANNFGGNFTGNGGALSNLSLTALGPAGSFDYAMSIEVSGTNQYPTDGTSPSSVAVGDVNGDGRVDLAIANGGSGAITIETNSGAGFGLAATIQVRAGANAIVLADLNRDGILDVLCANADNSIAVSRGIGNGLFNTATFHNSTPTLTRLAVGDLNGDGWPDIVAGANGASLVPIFMNDGAGNFSGYPSTFLGTAANPAAVALGDLNGDGRMDLVTGHGTVAGSQTLVALYAGNGLGFGTPVNLTTGSGLKTLALADVNRDGLQDIIVGNGQSGARVEIFLNSGPGNFTVSQLLPATYVSTLTVGDFNGDGWPDIAATDFGFFGYTGMRLMLNDGTGQFAQMIHLSPFAYGSVAAGDVNGDGQSELIAPAGGNPGVAAVFTFRVSPQPGMIVKGAATFQQNVGIGTLAPQQLLHLNVTPGHGEGIRIDSGIGGHAPAIYLNHVGSFGRNFRLASFCDNASAGSFRIRDDTLGGGDRFVIDSVGNVGIGTIAPTEKLHVAGNITCSSSLTLGSQTRQMINLWNNGYGIGVQTATLYNRSDGGFAWFRGGTHSDAQDDPGTGGTALMRLDGAGNLRTAGAINPPSDRNVKTAFEAVDAGDVLEKVAGLPLHTWAYTNDPAGIRHIGPVAQDFHAAFRVGMDDKHIATVDADGVALAAIQGLNRKLARQVKEKDEKIAALEARLNRLEQFVSRLTTSGK